MANPMLYLYQLGWAYVEMSAIWVLGLQLEKQAKQDPTESNCKMKLKGVLSQQTLRDQNREFAGTGGVSEGNRAQSFVPAFCNTRSGECVVSRFADGSSAPVHVLDGLPKHWISCVDENGHVTEVDKAVVAGFLHSGRFYTREEAAAACTCI